MERAPTSGSSVIGKAGGLLRAVSSAGGASTAGLAKSTGLTRPTVHRLLGSLAAEGLVDRDPDTGAWILGPEIYVLAATAADRYDVVTRAGSLLAELADRTGESAFLSVARDRETMCLTEVEGSFPLRSHVLHQGLRLPLGVASAGLAVLSHLPQAEADAYLRSSDLVAAHGRAHSARAVRARIELTREHGYAVNPGLLVEGSWGVAAAVFDRSGRPRWALSLTGVRSRFTDKRIPTLGRLLLRSAHQLGRRMA